VVDADSVLTHASGHVGQPLRDDDVLQRGLPGCAYSFRRSILGFQVLDKVSRGSSMVSTGLPIPLFAEQWRSQHLSPAESVLREMARTRGEPSGPAQPRIRRVSPIRLPQGIANNVLHLVKPGRLLGKPARMHNVDHVAPSCKVIRMLVDDAESSARPLAGSRQHKSNSKFSIHPPTLSQFR